MANIQIDITKNGTTTLATAGKYCDRNIDINVDTPPSGIVPTGSIDITENGTYDVTNYKGANVNVPTSQATQFTNLLADSRTKFTYNTSLGSSAGTTTARNGWILAEVYVDNYAYTNSTKCDVFRFRGFTPANGNIDVSTDGGTTWSRKAIGRWPGGTFDEYGDACFRTTLSANANLAIFRINLACGGITNANITEVDASTSIMTRSEPIGNGGYVG